MNARVTWSMGAIMGGLLFGACGGGGAPAPAGPAPGSGDAAFTALSTQILSDFYQRNPAVATDLGIHTYDAVLDDYSAAAVDAEVKADHAFRTRLDQVDAAALSPSAQLDLELLKHSLDSILLNDEVIKNFQRDPDSYSSGLTNAAYTLMKRNYAPASARLQALIAREQRMPAALDEARKNLQNPPKIFTEIAIEQIDGNIGFFKNDVPAAFKDVTDKALLAEFTQGQRRA